MFKGRRTRNSEAGFTLVEIAIVMVIIGLLIGGVLKGQEMIKNAKIKRVMKQVDELRAAALSYQDRFGLLPGDDNTAVGRPGWMGVANGNGNGQINGGNGTGAESLGLFQHLAAANLIAGNFAASSPRNPFGGIYFVQWANRNGNRQTNWFQTRLIPGDIGTIIDTSYDDGIFNTGSVRANTAYTPGNNVTMFIEF